MVFKQSDLGSDLTSVIFREKKETKEVEKKETKEKKPKKAPSVPESLLKKRKIYAAVKEARAKSLRAEKLVRAL